MRLDKIVATFPIFDDLTDFYKELMKVTIDVAAYKKSLASLVWAKMKIIDFANKYKFKIHKSRQKNDMERFRFEYYGRVGSFIKQVKKSFVFLDDSRIRSQCTRTKCRCWSHNPTYRPLVRHRQVVRRSHTLNRIWKKMKNCEVSSCLWDLGN